MSNLYQDAILDAKALRASAMANAKAALEEAFEPKIQEMISKHLSEEAEEELEEAWDEKHESVEEGEMNDAEGHEKMEEAEDINEAELEEILNQLEEMSAPKEESLNEASEEEEGEEKEEAGEEEEEEGEEEEEEADEDSAEGGEEVGDDTKIIDITLGDLKQVIQSLMPGQEAMPAAEEPTADSEAEAEVSLEEILDELAAEEMEEGANDIGKYNADDVQSTDLQGDETFQREEVSLQEKKKKAYSGYSNTITAADKKAEKKDAKNGAEITDTSYNKKVVKEADQELEEAKATIETLRKDLQEVNLLNAKYLYMNKLFKSNSLTESQKLQVINALDRATSVKEVKSTYDVMKESFEKKKSPLKESIGFASKPAGVAPKANIVEAESFINRWQKLAGIK